jgi:hypothetical protein
MVLKRLGQDTARMSDASNPAYSVRPSTNRVASACAGHPGTAHETVDTMTTALVVALIALAGSIVSAALTVFGPPALKARHDAKKELDTYREPLLAASYELQARLYNILQLRFIEKYVLNEQAGKQDSALESTLYVFAQYFGWMEIIREEVHYLRFSKDEQTREIGKLLRDIGEAFLSDGYGTQFMIWRVEQRGLGERMITASHGKLSCLGYASFLEQRPAMKAWLDPFAHDLKQLDDGGRKRLTEIQHKLLSLVKQLDQKERRYPFQLNEA